MSQTTTSKTSAAKAGVVTSATKANAVYTDLQTASTSIDDTNTRTEGLSRRHLKDMFESTTGERPTFHQLESVFQDAASLTYNNTAFADITHGGSCTLTFPGAPTLRTGEGLRLQASINMKSCTKGTSGGGNYALATDYYYYSFWATVNGVNTQISPSYGYSLIANSQCNDANYINKNIAFSDKIQSELIVNQREAFSYIYFNTAAPNKVITDCRVRFKVQVPLAGCTVNTVELKEFRLVAQGIR